MNSPVSVFFRDVPESTTWAVAQLGGPDAYYRPGGLFRTKSVNPSTILHETMHNLGKTDEQIQDAWRLPKDQGTKNISDKLKEMDRVRD
jgi:hypothetical protein